MCVAHLLFPILSSVALSNKKPPVSAFSQSSANVFFSPFPQLTGGTFDSENRKVIVVSLSEVDLSNIKAIPRLATSRANTYLSIEHIYSRAQLVQAVARDMAGLPVEEVYHEQAQQAASFVSDTASPNLNSFDLNLQQGRLVLHFDETVNASSFQPTAFSLFDIQQAR